MIRHLLKIIWNERKINSWILLEYVIVFCILWFCCDYLSFIVKSRYEPMGFDIENTYRLYVGERNRDTSREAEELDVYELAVTLLNRISQHPDVEAVSISSASIPYGLASSYSGVLVNEDSVWNTSIKERYVSTGYFDVFKIPMRSGKPFDWTDINVGNQRVITPDRKGNFGSYPDARYPLSQVRRLRQGEDGNEELQIAGITEKVKDGFYEPYRASIFVPLFRDDVNLSRNEIVLRVKPGTDPDFPERFTREMRPSLHVGPYFLSSVISMEKIKENAINFIGITDDLNSIYSITVFLVMNIFLGIVGTFWYRTQSRQSELGLRIALGATGKKVLSMVCLETLLLLFIASVVGVNICLNLAQTDLLNALGLPMGDRIRTAMGFEQDVINFIVTFSFLAVISLVAVWYPAKQASRVQPAEALKNE